MGAGHATAAQRIKRALPPRLRRTLKRLVGRGRFDEVELIHQLLREQPLPRTMVDVGAHHGASLEPFALQGWAVIAFEPDPKNRAVLQRLCGRFPELRLDPRALSNQAATEVPWYTSELSTGISSLAAFHESHEQSHRVEVTTLDRALDDHGVDRIDFLKIDAEGTDLFVLQGLPWKRIEPSVVLCEFEDAKTEALGYGFRDLAGLLVEQGYRVLVSEWHPITAYGARHRWRRLLPYPCELEDDRAWGNLIAVRSEQELERLMSLAPATGAPG
ncbi:MAG: FkbM family methyltransferase [Deltaproteobacteria bacterium]|nr:FkbM family methyltransferase [Deltaproteobacteria bacterium]